jgi:hypothetical protein
LEERRQTVLETDVLSKTNNMIYVGKNFDFQEVVLGKSKPIQTNKVLKISVQNPQLSIPINNHFTG